MKQETKNKLIARRVKRGGNYDDAVLQLEEEIATCGNVHNLAYSLVYLDYATEKQAYAAAEEVFPPEVEEQKEKPQKKEQPEKTPYQKGVDLLVDLTCTQVTMKEKFGQGGSVEEALDEVCDTLFETFHQALNHTGPYRFGVTSEEIEEFHFRAAVAQDALDNTHRPSVGHVRSVILEKTVERLDQ